MPPSSIETLSIFHCALNNSGLCSTSKSSQCARDLPNCAQDDPCPTIDSSSLLTDSNQSQYVASTIAAILLTLFSLMVAGFVLLNLWTMFQSKLIEPKVLTFEVYDPYDLPETHPKYFIID